MFAIFLVNSWRNSLIWSNCLEKSIRNYKKIELILRCARIFAILLESVCLACSTISTPPSHKFDISSRGWSPLNEVLMCDQKIWSFWSELAFPKSLDPIFDSDPFILTRHSICSFSYLPFLIFKSYPIICNNKFKRISISKVD